MPVSRVISRKRAIIRRRNRPRFSGADHASVRFDHRDDFRRRAGEETFVGDKDIVPGDIGFRDLEPELRRNLEHNRAGDARATRPP